MERASGLDPALKILLERAKGAIIDYGFVMDCLAEYSNPRVKLSHLLKIGALIRVKKGLYLFSDSVSKEPFSKEILANMIYGPSYVSLEWACQYYGLIPEKVSAVTSITTGRRKEFDTAVGLFTYDHLPVQAYAVGITRISVAGTFHALIATKEKAVADLLVLRRGKCTSKRELEEILFEDFRMDESDIDTLHLARLNEIYKAKPHSIIDQLIRWRQRI